MNSDDLDPTLFGDTLAVDAQSPEDLEKQLALFRQHLEALPATASAVDRARIELDIAETELALERKEAAWERARRAFDVFLENRAWQEAVEACNVLFQTEQPASLAALGMGVWLGVTFPIEPDTTVAMLQHIIDETPPDADGAAVAAIVAHYIADIRSPEDKHESLTFLTQNLLGQVAKRHSQVMTQDQMDAWLDRLELRDPQIFLPRLAKVVDVLVGDQWWFDRDALRATLPDQ